MLCHILYLGRSHSSTIIISTCTDRGCHTKQTLWNYINNLDNGDTNGADVPSWQATLSSYEALLPAFPRPHIYTKNMRHFLIICNDIRLCIYVFLCSMYSCEKAMFLSYVGLINLTWYATWGVMLFSPVSVYPNKTSSLKCQRRPRGVVGRHICPIGVEVIIVMKKVRW